MKGCPKNVSWSSPYSSFFDHSACQQLLHKSVQVCHQNRTIHHILVLQPGNRIFHAYRIEQCLPHGCGCIFQPKDPPILQLPDHDPALIIAIDHMLSRLE